MITIPKPKHAPSADFQRGGPLMKRPARLIKDWPPKGLAIPVHVDNTDLWQLARNCGRQNPWDIVIFNFETDDPRETNWYLHHFVGCWETMDGKNFAFDHADPGIIFLPPKGWVPDPGFERGSGAGKFIHAMIDAAASIVDRCAVGFPTLQHGQTRMTAHDFHVVSELINTRQVHIRIDTSYGSNAEYLWPARTITLGRQPRLGDVEMHGILANEATHVASHKKNLQEADQFKHEVTSTFVDSVVAAKMSRRWVERELGKTYWDQDKRYFAGWVVLTEFAGASFISLKELDSLFFHPYHKKELNPFEMLLEWHNDRSTYAKKKGKMISYDWDF